MDNFEFFRRLVCAALPVAQQQLGEGVHVADVAKRAIAIARAAMHAELAHVDDGPTPTRRSEAVPGDLDA